jgi:methionine-rich copper-binding protein CopC
MVVLIAVAGLPATAWAHAERASEEPKAGGKVDAAPEHLYVNLTEPPTSDIKMSVVDGCGRDVVELVEAQNRSIHAVLLAGQPGRWEVEYTVISGLDGHPTTDAYSFRVTGEADCSDATATEDPTPPSSGETDGGSGLPIVPIAIGAVILIAGAAALRMR